MKNKKSQDPQALIKALQEKRAKVLYELKEIDHQLQALGIKNRRPPIYYRTWLHETLKKSNHARTAKDLRKEYEKHFNVEIKENNFASRLAEASSIVKPFTLNGSPYLYGLVEWFDEEELKTKHLPKKLPTPIRKSPQEILNSSKNPDVFREV